MTAYFLRRLLLLVPTFLGITAVVFAITRLVPGGPIEQMLMKLSMGDVAGSGASDLTTSVDLPAGVLRELEARYHFDEPIWRAYLLWLGDLFTLDLGRSYKFNLPVVDVIAARLPVSLYFGLIGFVLAYAVCIPLGIAKALRHGSAFDVGSSLLVFLGYAIPGWALGALLLVLLGGGSFWDLVPLGGFRSPDWDELDAWGKVTDQLHHTVLPVLAYAAGSFATLTLLTKNALLDSLSQDYVRTAYAKGLSERSVVLGHALRNSLIPLCTGIGHSLGAVIAGSYLIEKVFNIDGIGYLGYTSIIERDYAVVLGILVVNTLFVLVGNILSDVLYVLADPRIRFT